MEPKRKLTTEEQTRKPVNMKMKKTSSLWEVVLVWLLNPVSCMSKLWCVLY